MKRTGLLIMLLLSILPATVLNAQAPADEESLNFTYLGPALSFAYNKIEYTDWIDSSTKTKKISGYALSGGLALNIFADRFCGDFQLKYTYNKLDSALTFFDFSASGKYIYPLNNYFSVGGGLGMYFNTPPSNRKYNGSGGLQLPLTLMVNTTQTTKLFLDIYSRYGSFGIGENTESLAMGVNVGFIFKVGRI